MSIDRDPSNDPGPDNDHVHNIMLQQRFVALWQRASMRDAATDPDAVWDELAKHYAEPHRHYHTEQHLAFCLQQLDLAGERIPQPTLVEMAVWFHDVIYRPGQRDNELRSTEWFQGHAAGVMPADHIETVLDLIMATTHREQVDEPEQQFICDIDLASFGRPWEDFVRSSAAVRAEHALSDEEFYRGERAFLSNLLKRPRIFLTDFFYHRYEQQARSNITRLVGQIDRRENA